jgi:hypothetical protein
MPRSYWDYDSVNISWGVLENYEIVRRPEVDSQNVCSQIIPAVHSLRQLSPTSRKRTGFDCRQLPEMRYQGPQACQEEEDQA